MRRLLLGAVVALVTTLVPVYLVNERKPPIAVAASPASVQPEGAPATAVGAPADVQGDPGDAPTRPATATKAKSLAPLRAQLAELLGDKDGTYGVEVLQLDDGDSAGVGESSVFPMASTFKVPMDMYIFSLASRGKADLEERLSYEPEDYEEGTGVLQDDAFGSTYTVRELMELAITQSDNVATNMLLRHFGRENVQAFEKQLGGHEVSQDDTNVSTPADMALYVRQLFNAQVIAPEHKDLLLSWMSHTAFHDRLEAGLPAGVTLAHKIGTLPGVCNDVGIVFAPKHTYVIAVMSRDVDDEDYAAGVITEVSTLVYNLEATL